MNPVIININTKSEEDLQTMNPVVININTKSEEDLQTMYRVVININTKSEEGSQTTDPPPKKVKGKDEEDLQTTDPPPKKVKGKDEEDLQTTDPPPKKVKGKDEEDLQTTDPPPKKGKGKDEEDLQTTDPPPKKVKGKDEEQDYDPKDPANDPPEEEENLVPTIIPYIFDEMEQQRQDWRKPTIVMPDNMDLLVGKYIDASKKLPLEKTHNSQKQTELKSIKEGMKKHEKQKTEKPSVQVFAGVSTSRLFDMVDNYDREGNAYALGPHAYTGTYSRGGENKAGERIPRAGVIAAVSAGRARAELSVFDAEVNGPNACVAAEASATGVTAMVRAELGSVSASAGPVNVTLGLGVDTGISAGVDGIGAQFLGTGCTIGPRPSVSFVGSKIECVVM